MKLLRTMKTTGYGPTMKTIQMVESAIRESKEYPSRYQLQRDLPKGKGYKTLDAVLKHLLENNKIMIDKDGTIIWIFADNPKLKNLLRNTTRLR